MGRVLATLVGVGAEQGFEHRGSELRFRALNGTANDLRAMARLLRQVADPAHLSTLYNDEASPASVMGQISAMTELAEPGDLLILMLTGHGLAVPDIDGDEAQRNPNDRFDEAFVAHGGLILDDDFSRGWSAAPKQSTILSVVDCCDADDLALGERLFLRALDSGVGRRLRGALPRIHAPDTRTFRESEPARVSISAVPHGRALEVAVEGNTHGLLTYCLTSTWDAVQPQPTLRSWFEATSESVQRESWARHRRQQPRLTYRGPDPGLLDRPPFPVSN